MARLDCHPARDNELSETKCPRCSSKIPHSYEKCPTCGYHAGPPNVREVRSLQEREALDARYRAALDEAGGRGCDAPLLKLEEAVKKSRAVVNVDLDFLYHFITNRLALYASYSRTVGGRVRKPAQRTDDAARRSIEDLLFPSYAEEISYAALSLNGSGLKSYGEYALQLREVAIEERATLLEENSFDFAERHGIRPRRELPRGFRATWADRHKLAAAKLAGRLSPSTPEAEFPTMLLRSEGRRETDDFVEVHIYGPFDINAVESVKGSSATRSKDERALLRIVKAKLDGLGITWVEE